MNAAEVTIIGPTPTTEHIRELQANGKWRLFNGVCFVGDYDTKEEAKKYGRMFGADRIAKAYFNGAVTEYREVTEIDAEV
ncbi:hypothetical protein FEZ48_06295 [Marinilactibacillus psychrotolerans]|uniref:Uncharacterized protein n=1 Tax=Marinilactibacillus psychrotolerans TaxID=191770 RepID=A0A5R9C3Z3_9LACT|nr:hypothetical protein [Marinilactibacillus psychrotolerans]TLQ07587.1 hypothetical protein FEZ48_06295 [Marinilactibacillus psychrotolerans]